VAKLCHLESVSGQYRTSCHTKEQLCEEKAHRNDLAKCRSFTDILLQKLPASGYIKKAVPKLSAQGSHALRKLHKSHC
jgi:hypothetical protein